MASWRPGGLSDGRLRGPVASSAALVALKCAVSAWALHVGFTHVSDDDYARVTIAQAFASAPRLDPSGTSWLPFPFWLDGVAMMLFGPSLAVARAVAVASGVVGALLVHRALLAAGVKPWVAFGSVVAAMSSPWNAWLGVATVPEALTASLVAAAAVSLATRDPRARVLGGALLLVATLSRYEAWPVAAVFAIASLLSERPLGPEVPVSRRAPHPGLPPVGTGGRSVRGPRRSNVAAAALAIAGPVAWLAWNAYAHGDALHFLARVAAYRVRVGGSGGTLALYPEAFARAAPLTMLLALLGAPGLLVDPELRARWRWPFVAAAALLVFLAVGDLSDGAPTHHPERALLAAFWLATTFGIDGARSLAVRFVWSHPKREAWMVGLVGAALVAWALAWPSRVADHPATSPEEDRTSQLARGAELRRRGVAHITVAPCAFEHFALIAAFESPARVTTLASAGTAVTADCPRVVEE